MSDVKRIQCWINIFKGFDLEELQIIIEALDIVKEELNLAE